MMIVYLLLIMIVLLEGDARAQNNNAINRFSRYKTEAKEKNNNSQNNSYNYDFNPTILDRAIDPKKYTLGPGDVFSFSINSLENIYFEAVIGPAGDFILPSIGLINISGLKLNKGLSVIKDAISTVYQNTEFDVSLTSLKSFKIQIIGQVLEPGFKVVEANTRLSEIIILAGGFQRYANEKYIDIKKGDGSINKIFFNDYPKTGNMVSNPYIEQGDVIIISIDDELKLNNFSKVSSKSNPVLVTGFVSNPGAINYIQGYLVNDYIGLAGGVTESGTFKKAYLFRAGKKIRVKLLDSVSPGDHLFIPENLYSLVVGKNSFLQTVSAFSSFILSYIAISKQ